MNKVHLSVFSSLVNKALEICKKEECGWDD